MLIDDTAKIGWDCNDPMLAALAAMNGHDPKPEHVMQGVYMIGHYGGGMFLRHYDHYPDLGDHNCYGVCDSIGNLLDTIPDLQHSCRLFLITLTKVECNANNKGKSGGWRWHKWGPYIGAHEPQCEYLDDEDDIDFVYVYHVYEKR